MPEVAMHVIISQHKGAQCNGNSKMRAHHTSFILINYGSFVLCAYATSIAEMSVEKYLHCSGGCKVNEMPF